MTGDKFIIGFPTELDPYLTGISTKSKKGMSYRFDVSNVDDNYSISPEFGFNTGYGLSAGVGSTFSESEGTNDFLRLNWTSDNINLEAKLSDKQSSEFYASVNF